MQLDTFKGLLGNGGVRAKIGRARSSDLLSRFVPRFRSMRLAPNNPNKYKEIGDYHAA